MVAIKAAYRAWVGKTNDSVQHIMQDHLDSCTMVFDSKAPLVTTSALTSFQNLHFSGTDGNSISDGLLPFAFIPRHELATAMKERLEAINQVDTYGDLMTMSGSLLLLADLKTL